MRRSITACGLVLAFAGISTTAAVSAGAASAHARRAGTHVAATAHSRAEAHKRAVAFYTAAIRRWRTETWYWQRVMGVRRTNLSRSLATHPHSVHHLQQLAARWRRRAEAAARHGKNPPNLKAWLCIHHYEGSWTDPGAPYYGGLQMDLSFQRAYGGWLLRTKGTADHWTPLEQIWTAVKARRLRGYYPWPNTARYCGLL